MITKEQLNSVIMKMTPDQMIGFIKSLGKSDTHIAIYEICGEKYCQIYVKVRPQDWKPYNEMKWYDKIFTNEREIEREWARKLVFSSFSVEGYERPLRTGILHLLEMGELENIKLEYVQSFLNYYIPQKTL